MALLVAGCVVAFAACRDERRAPASLADALRCGMTAAEVRQLAAERGYNSSDPSWLSRAARRKPQTRKELLDFTFHGGRLVAVRIGTYDPRSKQVTYRTVDLCSAHPDR